MQLYARDITGKKCNVHSAKKGNDYFCLECNARVRVRSGELLRAHFYHIHDQIGCRQAGKTQEHIAIQRLIQQQIGNDCCVEEMRFAAIGRIGDVAWPERRLIFEVQCSPISAKEIEERNHDYASCGWDVVWILYDKTFNQKRISAAEKYLAGHTHYFSDALCVYDRIGKHKRLVSLDTIERLSFKEEIPGLSDMLKGRFCSWAYYTSGDYLWAALHLQERIFKTDLASIRKYLGYGLYPARWLLGALRAIWLLTLERCCR